MKYSFTLEIESEELLNTAGDKMREIVKFVEENPRINRDNERDKLLRFADLLQDFTKSLLENTPQES